MSESMSYKDMKSSFNEGRFPQADAPVDPMKTKSRRPELQRFMVWLLPPWNKRLREQWHVAEQKACADLASAGCKSISEPWFEFEVDRIVYLHFFKLFKECFKREVPGWPWEGISHKDLTSPQDRNSALYDKYLKNKEVAAMPAEKNGSAKETTEMEGVEGPATEKPPAASGKLHAGGLSFEHPTNQGPESRQTKDLSRTGYAGGFRERGSARGRDHSRSRGRRPGRGSHRDEARTRAQGRNLTFNGDEFERKHGDPILTGRNSKASTTRNPRSTTMSQEEANNAASSLGPYFPGTVYEVTKETLMEDMDGTGTDLQKRTRVWNRYIGPRAIEDPIVGPFEMKIWDFIPTDIYISEDRLARANLFYSDVRITFNRRTRMLIVGFAAQKGPGTVPARMEIINAWSDIQAWMTEVCSLFPPCLDDVVYRQRILPCTIPDDGYLQAMAKAKRDPRNIE
ncbi:hypothetical protein NOF04DRAFT_21615 [Fusarium oxysporum II5]|uniref:Uncharacterized protein n=2 Tax=Fusarium oxysporum species complex TaxID=171631 RepID=X0JL70_FUSO5|nr:uncharacterized protein FOIG_06344 [Fusarium odoratissimum NRRL 54006]EXM02029.1 hypothetical protein FOIG_06344 [Fusarium odoratissimum NRRL 54006]KAK2133890.1 hypothetical protein NOF04DRAFT_21615 [Fusarium oxysporum II5]TXC08068.1 hypothetical protein FocTR4_00004130 [Fusarium oxysporum f. sp. cubense]